MYSRVYAVCRYIGYICLCDDDVFTLGKKDPCVEPWKLKWKNGLQMKIKGLSNYTRHQLNMKCGRFFW